MEVMERTKTIWAATHRQPNKTVSKKFWESSTLLISAIITLAAVLLATTRTSYVFYEIALLTSIGDFFAKAEAGLTIFVIESAITGFTYLKAVYEGKTDINDQKWFIWGIGVAFVVSFVANLFIGALYGKALISDGVLNASKLIIGIAVGISATIMALVGGEVLAVAYLRWKGENDVISAKNDNLLNDYWGEFSKYWETNSSALLKAEAIKLSRKLHKEIAPPVALPNNEQTVAKVSKRSILFRLFDENPGMDNKSIMDLATQIRSDIRIEEIRVYRSQFNKRQSGT